MCSLLMGNRASAPLSLRAGELLVHVLSAQNEYVRGAPFVLYVSPTDALRHALRQQLLLQPDCVQVNGAGVDAREWRVMGIESEFQVTFDARRWPVPLQVDAKLLDVLCYKCSSGKKVELRRSERRDLRDGRQSLACTYLPKENGFHTLFVLYAGLNVDQSPYRVRQRLAPSRHSNKY